MPVGEHLALLRHGELSDSYSRQRDKSLVHLDMMTTIHNTSSLLVIAIMSLSDPLEPESYISWQILKGCNRILGLLVKTTMLPISPDDLEIVSVCSSGRNTIISRVSTALACSLRCCRRFCYLTCSEKQAHKSHVSFESHHNHQEE